MNVYLLINYLLWENILKKFLYYKSPFFDSFFAIKHGYSCVQHDNAWLFMIIYAIIEFGTVEPTAVIEQIQHLLK